MYVETYTVDHLAILRTAHHRLLLSCMEEKTSQRLPYYVIMMPDRGDDTGMSMLTRARFFLVNSACFFIRLYQVSWRGQLGYRNSVRLGGDSEVPQTAP